MITFRDVSLGTTHGAVLLQGITDVWPVGTIAAVVGPPGSGKSLLLSALNGRHAPLAGRLRVGPLDPARDAVQIRRDVCTVVAGAPLLPHLTVLEHVRCLIELADGGRPAERSLVHALRLSELPDWRMRLRVADLSEYERLCVWLATYRLRRATVLLLDDPTPSLSARQVEDLARLLREVRRPACTVVVTSHDVGFASAIADRVRRIADGRLLEPEPSGKLGVPAQAAVGAR